MCLFTRSRSLFLGDIKATHTMRLMMMKARSLHALNCRMNIVRRTWNCSLARTCSRACNHIHIHKAFSEMFDGAWLCAIWSDTDNGVCTSLECGPQTGCKLVDITARRDGSETFGILCSSLYELRGTKNWKKRRSVHRTGDV